MLTCDILRDDLCQQVHMSSYMTKSQFELSVFQLDELGPTRYNAERSETEGSVDVVVLRSSTLR